MTSTSRKFGLGDSAATDMSTAEFDNAKDIESVNHSNLFLSETLAAGVDLVRGFGSKPIIVVPSKNYAAIAQDVIISGAEADCDFVLIFPGSVGGLEEGIRKGRLPKTKRALVFEDERWRVTVAPRAPSQRARPVRVARRLRSNKRIAHAMGALRRVHWARRVQPFLDRRENDLLATLLEPGDFPYRMTNCVEKRVLLAVSSLSSGGAERQIINTAEGLSSRGIEDVHILVEHLDHSTASEAYVSRARRVAASVQELEVLSNPARDWVREHTSFRNILTDNLLSRILSACAAIVRLSPEIVQTSLDWTNITIGIAAVLAGVPKVYISGRNLSPHHFEFFQWFMYPAYRALSRCPDVYFLNNSEAGRRDYCKWLRLAPDRISLLRNGLDNSEFRPVGENVRAATRAALGLTAECRVIVGAFRFSPEKRPFLWIDTAAKIKSECPNAKFLLCGVGPLVEATRQRAIDRGLGNSVQFVGSRDDIASILSIADVILQTSLQEGTPNVLIEGQALGIPVVTSPAFGAAEAVENDVTGYVVRSPSATALSRRVLSILKDANFGRRAADIGPRFVEKRFGLERMVTDTLAAYGDSGSGLQWARDLLPDDHRLVLSPSDIRHDSGFSWIISIPKLQNEADREGECDRSRLSILEDGVGLGPAHALHSEVRQKGRGRYSHWEQDLYFSSSDGSDPRKNGREYVAVLPGRKSKRLA